MIRNHLFAGKIITTQTSDTNLISMISTMVSMEDVLSENNVPDLCLVSRNEINETCSFPIYMKSKENNITSDSLMFECRSTMGNEPNIHFYDINGNRWPSSSRISFVIHDKPPSSCDKESPSILLCANETHDETLPPCNSSTLRDGKMKAQPCWIHVSSEDERDTQDIMIRHQTSSEIYCLEHTFRNGSVCRIMEINVAVHEKPICTTIYTPINNTLQLSCQWKQVDIDDGAQLMIRNRLFAGKIITTQTSDTNLISMISTMVSMEDVLSENNVPDLCLVSRNEINETCSFPIYMKSKENNITSDSLMFECRSTMGNEPNIHFYDINGNRWPSSSRISFVIHDKPPSSCDKESPSILLCANETHDELIVYGLAKLFLPTQSQILTRISHVSKPEMMGTGHFENIFNIDVRLYPPMLIDVTTPSILNKTNASDIRKRQNITCQQEHFIAPTLTTDNLRSKSRTAYPNECLEQRNITREVHIGCLSISVHSDLSLTETIRFIVRKFTHRDVLISCYLFHGVSKCVSFSNQSIGAILYANLTIGVSLFHAKVEDSGKYVLEIGKVDTIPCEIARVNIHVFDMLKRDPTCSTRIRKNSRNLQFNCEWLQNDTYTGRARLMIENQTIHHYSSRWKRDETNQCFTFNNQTIDVNLKVFFSERILPYSCEVSYRYGMLKTCNFTLYMEPDTIKLPIINHEINIISFDCFTKSESIPSIWYYETDECSLTNITGQSVQISNRVQRRSSRRVHDDYIILLCGKENEDDFELNGIGRIMINSLDYSNISISGESLGIKEGTKKTNRTYSYKITLISKILSTGVAQVKTNSITSNAIPANRWDMRFCVNERSPCYVGMLWYIQTLFIIVFMMSFIYIVYHLTKYCQKRSYHGENSNISLHENEEQFQYENFI